MGIAFDSTDAAVAPAFVEAVQALGADVRFASRWLNAAAVVADSSIMKLIAALPFVRNVEPGLPLTADSGMEPAEVRDSGASAFIASGPPPAGPCRGGRLGGLSLPGENINGLPPRQGGAGGGPEAMKAPDAVQAEASTQETTPTEDLPAVAMDLLRLQTERMGGSLLRKQGLTGKGVRIAIFDVGFVSVDIAPEFSRLREEGRIVGTWDFVRRDTFVYSYSPHGTMVLSCLAGESDGVAMGLAPDADYLLIRTERPIAEPFSEEINWMDAVEWADRKGADVVNSSLGYTKVRYFPSEMDGNKSLVCQAALKAKEKGIVVVNSAGNEGQKRWRTLATPGDSPHLLTVGGTDPNTDSHIGFSSFGPTADGRLKPDVCAYGRVVARSRLGLTLVSGTSFSSPLVAGFAACIRQRDSTLVPDSVFSLLRRIGHLHPYFDYAHGYGIPQAAHWLAPTPAPKKQFEIQREFSLFSVYIEKPIKDRACNLYYHIQGADGRLKFYAAIQLKDEKIVRLPNLSLETGDVLRVHYEGETQELIQE